MRYEPVTSAEEEKEIWEDVDNFSGHYLISSFGRIKSLKFNREIILKTYSNKRGYVQVDLCINGKYTKCYVHRLVAQHFIPNSENLPEVNHEDGDKLNNKKNNLNWTNGVGNMQHAFNKLGQSPIRNKKLTENDVMDIHRLCSEKKITLKEIAKKYNINYNHLWGIRKGICWPQLKPEHNEIRKYNRRGLLPISVT